ncbi:RNA polymerase sigma factor SigZ [Prolixibacteraceae bacterium Z1-6]|uniref:RNA polymerase sigma factor SigZ n=1 Tax=Draconibacterium aestuarii TaxID=2998507 RepID=A0A9X3F510_9BACT|nr:RNA polymerase sigma factor SigZ [Prolixibacteraceae bacterium Z1-6]
MEKENIHIESVWNEYYDQLLRFIRKRVPDKATAEDLLQNVFLKMLTHIDSLKDSTKIKSWLFQITRNAIADHFRKAKKTENIPVVLSEENNELSDDVMEEVESWVAPFINNLPAKYREALLLSELKGMSQKEMALYLGITYSAAKTRVHRGRLLLKQELTECCIFHTDKYGNIMNYESNPNYCKSCNN